MMHGTRRQFLHTMAGATALAAGGPYLGRGLARAGRGASDLPLAPDREWLSLLGTSLTHERTYETSTDGAVPRDLVGTLYRNGPGLFERDGHRKRNILDGDGMIQAFRFVDGRVHYRNRFVRTEKYIEEERAGRFLDPTWTTLAPRWTDNLPGFPRRSQAGVTVVPHAGRLFAIDEVGPPYELDAGTLETVGPYPVTTRDPAPDTIKAHTKTDATTGEWVVVGWSNGASTWLDVVIRNADGTLKRQRRVRAADGAYVHDFFATRRFVVVALPALRMSPFPMLLGLKSVTESLEWTPEQGNRVMVIDKEGDADPIVLDAPPAFMWHSVNAYERGDEIVADFVGYDAPDHFIGDDPEFESIMRGRRGTARSPGTLRRYVVNVQARTLREETIIDAGDATFEFPMINPLRACDRYRFGYACIGQRGTMFHDGIARVDMQTGATDTFRFGSGYQVGEPVFVPKPDAIYTPHGPQEPGWLLALTLDGSTRTSFLALFEADRLRDGPIARVHLQHHSPYSFHGCWRA